MTESPYQELIDLMTEQRELIHQGHVLLTDLRREIKTAREYVGSDIVKKRIEDAVAAGLKDFDRDVEIAIKKGTQAAYDRFDVLTALLLGLDPESVRQGKKSLIDLIREFIQTKHLPVELVELERARQEVQNVPAAYRKKPKNG